MQLTWKEPFLAFVLTMLVFVFANTSDNKSSPYPDFEAKLKEEICNCVSLRNSNNGAQYLEEYEACMAEKTGSLKDGLSQYRENTEVSKDEYLESLPELIVKLERKCSRKRGK